MAKVKGQYMRQSKKFKVTNLKNIDRKMNLGELVSNNPEAGRILAEDYGLHCVGCMAAQFDTLEAGMKIHGYQDKEIDKVIKKLNQLKRKK